MSIAGSDSCGGAGIQADIKTISALGGYAATAITAVTAQNTCGITAIHPIPPEVTAAQIEAVMSDLRPRAVKIGMVNDAATAEAIAEVLLRRRPEFVVLDPVMVSTSGSKLIDDDAIDVITRRLMPIATLITPNLNEAQALVQAELCTVEDMQQAARQLLRYGSRAVLIKGGHLQGAQMCDVLQVNGEHECHFYTSPKVESRNTHGTGCTLSSAIATRLALGDTLTAAIQRAKSYVFQGIKAGKDIHIGEGHGPINHFYAPVPLHISTVTPGQASPHA